jgi:predicted Ser/Thr protein kinase
MRYCRDASTRGAYLDEVCADDPDLRSHVIRLLAVHQETDSFLERGLDVVSVVRDDTQFTGTSRFRVLRQLGAGGMGVVYEVHDGLRNEVVALKTLRRAGAADLYRLKHEFRSLADVTHPNLVPLYELFVEDERSFFTMERVSGVSFVEYVRGADRSQLSVARLVPALRQLVDGVSELHRRGKLHRDIKPSNVLVTREGRVVILDFGLVAEALPPQTGETAAGGTPAYMSPEEIWGGAPSEAGDWYSVGVTLYEALTGALPFAGSVSDLLLYKTTSDPPAPAQTSPDVPGDLSDVCMGLLNRFPEHRLTGPAVLRALMRDGVALLPASVAAMLETPFVGRHHQLHALKDAVDAVIRGSARVVTVHASSGLGKSALVRHFLGQFSRRDDVVVLTGRCYEYESVPYKALDGVIDDLSRYLGSIPAEHVEALLPPDVSALPRVFPVLRQVDAIANAAGHDTSDVIDPLRVRRRAFEALRVLLARLAERRSLVIWIDDLQWADADSVVLLEELLDAASPPVMLTLLSFRREETATKPFLRALLDRAGRTGWSAVSLEPMTDAEAETLIRELLPRDTTLTADDRRRMARESDGSPLVLEQLALYTGVALGETAPSRTFCRHASDSRLEALPSSADSFSRRWPSAAGRWRLRSSATPAAWRAIGSRSS